jgi:hypothetical protein
MADYMPSRKLPQHSVRIVDPEKERYLERRRDIGLGVMTTIV